MGVGIEEMDILGKSFQKLVIGKSHLQVLKGKGQICKVKLFGNQKGYYRVQGWQLGKVGNHLF